MSRFTASSMAFCVGSLLLALAACSPAFNWREVRPEGTRLSFLLPCKPDKAEKLVPLGGQPTTLRMQGCEASGVTFAVSVADIGDAAKAAGVLSQWQNLTLANMKAPLVDTKAPAADDAKAPQVGVGQGPQASQQFAWKVPGASAGAPAIRVKALGRQADGKPVQGEAAYFSAGPVVVQAVVYADQINAEVADTFFDSFAIN